ncbi:MAG: EAL domain-containing protein [Spirochaetales bacterium]|nr:EAL domain-containing protein [Spirochaetales bacterium]
MKNERIYIVEDERIIAIDLKRRLERMGYQVCGSASDGETALAGIRTEKPDLILMDVVIQGPMDGIEVARIIYTELHIPVIFLSAYTDGITLDRARDAHPLGYILKPFKERELANLLEMALYKSSADTQIREKEQLFSAILNSTTDAILVLGRSNEVLFINPEAEQILEIKDTEARAKRLQDLLTLMDMETAEPFSIPDFSDRLKILKAHNLRLTNHRGNSFVVEMTVNHEVRVGQSHENYIVSFKDISRLHEMTDAIRYQTSHDILTGLLNRNELALRMNTTLAKAPISGASAHALFIDVDHFRVVNDSCGTQAGDVLLKEIADRIRTHVTPKNYAARTGGDDFVLVYIQDGPSQKDVSVIARDLLEAARAHPFKWNRKEYPITLSIAIVPLDSSFKSEHDVMIAGAQTVLATHESGGGRFCFYERTDGGRYGSLPISEWISRIHSALQNDGFRLYYQPIEPLSGTGKRHKLEVLIRMVDESGAIIQPGDFIPIAERYNIMPAIDRWVIKNSFRQYAELSRAGDPLADRVFSVNLSGASLVDGEIIEYIIDKAREYRVPPAQFCIEITESNAILNLTSASRIIHILHEQGFTFALDDFGSGFSSFSYLKNLPVDYLKIDGSFIRNMDKDHVDYTMVQAITSMCHVLSLEVVGEFAENGAIIKMLHEIGVDYAQGYGISKPLPLDGSAPGPEIAF